MNHTLSRRALLAAGLASLSLPRGVWASDAQQADAPRFSTANSAWQTAYDKALAVLVGNVQVMPYVTRPVLIEGSVYRGIWQECGPHEALVYRKFRPDVARNSHLTFFELQRADGQLPANNKVAETGFGQIQMVVPIAATAWELARDTGDGELLEAAYRACGAWDAWLVRYRNTRGTGLVEGFCTYDTGHDNSPRWAGVPNQCPNKDARRHHDLPGLPRLCPALSATLYGARRALADMARALGRNAEADRWTEQAELIRSLILSKLYVAEDAAFYDLDAENKFIRVRSDVISRVCGEHVVDQPLFDTLWTRQLHNPKAFWGKYPLSSIAMDDPSFVRPIPANSWGGGSQGLTALRAPRWMDHYGRAAEFSEMMDRWCDAIQADLTFRQQMDPDTGIFTHGEDHPNYSPTALVMVDYTWRLIGVVEEPGTLYWNIRPRHKAAQGARLSLPLDGGGSASVTYDAMGADLTLSGRPLARVEGGAARLITAKDGSGIGLLGISPQAQRVTLLLPGRAARHFNLKPNQRLTL
ncbi:MAG: MGH1-like glycoside hydrolase domain-containing protein [Niveispirillum sp.]|uniref:MGH1-like glycoside hydrolase domain-containing protein n=1 Tax=Niveispirillum sp. TaxID=1917217 RepID=UPI003BA5EB70